MKREKAPKITDRSREKETFQRSGQVEALQKSSRFILELQRKLN